MAFAATALDVAERHIDSLQRMIAFQMAVVARMEATNDDKGAAIGQKLLETFRQSLKLAIEHRDYLLRQTSC